MTETWHGTAGGYTNHGCKEECCRAAWRERMALYRKQRHFRGRLTVPNLSTVRRIQALTALGWTPTLLSPRLGMNAANVAKLREGANPHVRIVTHQKVLALYRELCMTLPPDTAWTRKQRANAQRLGWFPPLAWDDIEDPDEYPGLHVLWGEGEDAA